MERTLWLAKSKNGKSIQDSVEKALKKVLKTRIRIIGSGRTDKSTRSITIYKFQIKKKIKEKNIFLNSMNFF